MLSYGLISLPHFGQRDAGLTTDFPAGSRLMHTFRKLPTISPNKNTNAAMNPAGSIFRLCHKRERASMAAACNVPDG
jgi:hypothetical protein